MEESTVEAEILWAPSAEMVERSQLAHYMRWLAENRDLHFDDYQSLWRWSVEEIEEFWGTIWEHFEVISGSLGVRIAGREQVLRAGESVAVPPGTPHTIWKAGEGETHVLVAFQPALQTEAFFETMSNPGL